MSVHSALTTYSCECESCGVRPVRIPKRRREKLAYRVQSAKWEIRCGWLRCANLRLRVTVGLPRGRRGAFVCTLFVELLGS